MRRRWSLAAMAAVIMCGASVRVGEAKVEGRGQLTRQAFEITSINHTGRLIDHNGRVPLSTEPIDYTNREEQGQLAGGVRRICRLDGGDRSRCRMRLAKLGAREERLGLHQSGRIVLLALAPDGDRDAPPYRRAVPAPVRR